MIEQNINDFTQEKTCIYKNETYSVRDNGAVMRHSREIGQKRSIDGNWTFGNLDDKGFLRIGGEKINRIVATAFRGNPPNEQHVVFHKNYNSQDNRAANLCWVTKFEFKVLQPNIQSQLRILTVRKAEYGAVGFSNRKMKGYKVYVGDKALRIERNN
ncbi:MAG: HNH endonuclease [Treponema sp.]|nr:HNH endonuclease [Treponema sp.]